MGDDIKILMKITLPKGPEVVFKISNNYAIKCPRRAKSWKEKWNFIKINNKRH